MQALQSEPCPPYQSIQDYNQVEVHETGFTTLFGANNTLVDFIFVHGIGGGPKETWSNKTSASQIKPKRRCFNFKPAAQHAKVLEPETFWPQDFLPSSFPGARILTWGYESGVSGAPKTIDLGLYDSIYKDLLYDLYSIRIDDPKRPIIWIAHGFGRTIVKEVLLSSTNDTRDAGSIYESTRALLFLGTPIGTPIGTSIGALHQRYMQERFNNLLRLRQREIHPANFPETDVTTEVVNDYSLVMDHWAIERSLPGKYEGMCKFSDRGDTGYRRIKGELESVVKLLDDTPIDITS
ncbi:hypothetical protein V500_02057 [Pseudogymnoascus sp. VKM F-4518 (FW-2643)]|nr:hypothetical protein V500_02057 [Pseudogymnoascus sp. VKM F-4518 (FW-2643)]